MSEKLDEFNRYLYISCVRGDIHLFKLLLDNGASPFKMYQTDSCIAAAASTGRFGIVKKLKSMGVPWDSEEGPFRSVSSLVETIKARKYKMFKYIVDKGANLNYSCGTPLIVASQIDDPRFCKYLIEKGADVSYVISRAHSTHFSSAFEDCVNCYNYLVDIGAIERDPKIMEALIAKKATVGKDYY